MEKTARKRGANAKRDELRNGRIRDTSEAGATPTGLSGNDADPLGATFQDARREAGTLTPTGGALVSERRRNRNNQRSTPGLVERERRSDRRPQESDGGAIVDSAADEKPTRQHQQQHAVEVGRFATDEIIDEPTPFKLDITPDGAFAQAVKELSKYKEDYRRTTRDGQNVYAMIDAPELFVSSDTYKQLASRKDAPPEQPKPKMWKQAVVLGAKEAEDLREPLEAGLSDGGGYIDKLLWKSCPQLDERPVWSNLTEIECRAIAKLLLKRGQVDPAAATVVRTIVDSADYATVIMAIGPRVLETGQALRDRPRVQRKQKFSVVRTIGGENAN